ncbi:MAG: UvrD-helicase domain-containing protein [Candidatus Desulforudaceae bacterium]
MNSRPNVTYASNVFVLQGDFSTDLGFRSIVRGRKSLEAMLRRLTGLDWVRGAVSLDDYTDLLTDVQSDDWNLGIPCFLLDDRQDIVWGLIRDNNEYRIVCRCYRQDCRHFHRCRPEYVPGMVLPYAPGEISGEELNPKIKDWISPTLIIPDPDEDIKGSPTEEIVIGIEPDSSFPGQEEPQVTDDSQDAIVTGVPDSRILVLAGPGTGKTHSLLLKLEYLVDKKRMVEANSILLLCFTKAAVREIKDRFLNKVSSGEYSDDLARMDIRTFDSFATLVLIDRGIDCTGLDYDTRIQNAIDEINGDPGILEGMRHFLVDEIQDLVGVRARLVQAILRNRPPGCGFTLLGDHFQAIYDYSVRDVPQEIDSRCFLKWIRQEFGDSLTTVNLTTNRRQSTRLAVISSRCRTMLENEDAERLKEFLNAEYGFPEEKGYRRIEPKSESDKVAILTRTNGLALKMSGYLRQQSIKHTLRSRHARWLLPVWLADLLGEGRKILTRDDLDSIHGVRGWDGANLDRLFELLQDLGKQAGRTVTTEKIRRALTTSARLPDEIYEEFGTSLVVSTIHQSKGREYDRVYVWDPQVMDQENLNEEGRIYYVALTRARSDFRRLVLSRPYTWMQPTDHSKRWMELGRRPDGTPRLVGTEIGLDFDVDEESFVDKRIPGFNQVETQRYVREEVAEGDSLIIRRPGDDDHWYGIYHRDRLIGRMSDRFTSGVREVMGNVYVYSRHLPQAFSDVYVRQLYSVFRKPETISADVAEPYITTGVWYGVSPVGLGKVRFS